MKRTYQCSWVLLLLSAFLLMLTNSESVQAAPELTISNYELVLSKRITRTVFEYTYKADITNTGSDALDVSATLSVSAPGVTVLDGQLSFGDVPQNATLTSGDVFVVRQDRGYAVSDADFSWSFTFGAVGSGVIGPEGGTISGRNGKSVIIPPNALSGLTEVVIRDFNEDGIMGAVPKGFLFLGAIHVDFGRVTLADNAEVSVPAFPDIPLEASLYVAQLVNYAGKTRFRVVDTASVVGDVVISQDPAFPGVIESGTYVFLLGKDVGWISGFVRSTDTGDVVPGAVVTLSGGYWLDVTDEDGRYAFPGEVGSFVVTAFDPRTGSKGVSSDYMLAAGTSVTVDIELVDSTGNILMELTNGGFESGDFSGWDLQGTGAVVPSFGPIMPDSGEYMAIVTNGTGAVGEASSALKQSFSVPAGATTLTLRYNFVSEEYPEYVGSVFNDVFVATLETPDGLVEVAFKSVNDAAFTGVSGLPCGSGDCTWGQTGWLTAVVDVTKWAGTEATLTLSVYDVGDTIFDSVVLLDNISLDSGDGVLFFNDQKGINTPWTTFGLSPADVIKFSGSTAEELRSLEKESKIILFGLFLGLHFDGVLKAWLSTDNFNDFIKELAADGANVAIAEAALAEAGVPGEIISYSLAAVNFLRAYNIYKNIVESTGDFYIVLPEYNEYEIPIANLFSNGVIFAADDLKQETLDELSIWVDAVHLKSFDEMARNPDGYSLGKGNYNCLTDKYDPVPNNYVPNICISSCELRSCWTKKLLGN